MQPLPRNRARMRLYVAGPMTGLPDLNFPAFHAAATNLREVGYEVVNPAEVVADKSTLWLDCMRADIKALADCDGIAELPGCAQSRGATIEITLFAGLGLPVKSVGEWMTAARSSPPAPAGIAPGAACVASGASLG